MTQDDSRVSKEVEELVLYLLRKGLLDSSLRMGATLGSLKDIVEDLKNEKKEAYVTAHLFSDSTGNPGTSVRLWSKKPKISNLGHPDWSVEAVLEFHVTKETFDKKDFYGVDHFLSQDCGLEEGREYYENGPEKVFRKTLIFLV